jgi:hypothetical protein
MLKKMSKVVVLDAGVKVEVVIKVSCDTNIWGRSDMSRDEIRRMALESANACADSLNSVPGLRARHDNTRVSV